MQSTRIHRATRSSISALGQFVADFDLLQTELEKLRPGAKSVIAEPVLSTDGATIDWYVPGRVSARPLDSATPEELEMAEDSLSELRALVIERAEELKRSTDPDSHHLAAALGAMFTVPSREFMFLVEGHPVLAGWAHRKDETEAHRVGFHVLAAVPAPAPASASAPEPGTDTASFQGSSDSLIRTEAVTPVPPRRRTWLMAALLALLLLFLAVILWLLFRACAIAPLAPVVNWFGLETGCETEIARISTVQSLTRQLEDLERQIALDVSTCGPAQDTDLDRRLENARIDVSRGEFEITLLWTGKSDLDLAVTFECGPGNPKQITFKDVNKTICNGVLDKDFNRQGGSDPNAEAAEHVTWARLQDLPPGPMKIYVTRYTTNADPRPDVPYDLVIHHNGDVTRKISGQASSRGRTATDRRRLVLTLDN
ncbi:hypothetical protein [Roseibium sp.]|uniref:hypothetical protein n=1 Tax=Roseibium sp. TaxID=1936156 RepID=UPI003266ADC1